MVWKFITVAAEVKIKIDAHEGEELKTQLQTAYAALN